MDILPEKWYFKPNTEDEIIKLREWLPKSFDRYSDPELKQGFNYPNTFDHKEFRYGFHVGKANGYTEISFEDFKNLVLKEEIHSLINNNYQIF